MKIFDQYKIILLLLVLAGILGGCAAQQQAIQPDSAGQALQPIEVPDYLAENGQKILDAGRVDEAEQLFNKALAKEPKHIPSLVGLSRVETKRGNLKKAVAYTQTAFDSAESAPGRTAARTAAMQVHWTLRQGDWFARMEFLWKSIRKKNPQPEEATLLMGQAYLETDKALKASVCFRQVLDWGGRFSGEADRMLADLYRRLRAEPGSAAGREVARRDRLARGDLAVLVVEELKLPDYLAAREPKKYNTGFTSPQKYSEQKKGDVLPADVSGHPYEMDIKAVMAMGIRGLEPLADGLFHLEQPVSRAGFALAVEDILVQIKNEPGLKTAFIGNESPFPDVAPDNYAFNAIVVCTTRHLLAADLDGAFRPDDDVSGAECLLTIRQLKEEIKSQQVNFK